jgi:hypothetical protein
MLSQYKIEILDTHFIATLFMVVKLWNQPACHGCMNKKLWYVYTREYYSAIKKNEIMALARKWVELEIIMLNKISQTQVFSHMQNQN